MYSEQKTALQKKTETCNKQSVRILQSTLQMQDTMKLLVTDAAVCAANSQVATNAIVKLAGDLGSITAIVMASDFNTGLSKAVTTVSESINKTTYAAELASELGMETSMLVSQLGVVSLIDFAETINGQLAKLEPTVAFSVLLLTNQLNKELLTTPKKVLADNINQNSTTHTKLNITEKKKSILDKKVIEISANQVLIDELQERVNLLTREINKHQENIASIENYRMQAKANKELANTLALTSKSFVKNTEILTKQMLTTEDKVVQLSTNLKKVSDLLVKATDLFTLCSNKIVKMKALNPLISDDLVSKVNVAGTNAINAITLTNIAIQSVKTLKKESLKSRSAALIVKKQVSQLQQMISGKTTPSLHSMYVEAYKNAEIGYRLANRDSQYYIKQLNEANLSLTKTKTKLMSLKAALAAGVASAVATN